MITYPYDPPTSPAFQQIEYGGLTVSPYSQSPQTLAGQVRQGMGEGLTFQATLPPMKRAAAEDWIAWRLALRGRYGYFRMGVDPSARTPRGAVTGSPVANTSASPETNFVRSPELYVRSLPTSTSKVFRAGDWISLAIDGLPRLHKVLRDVDSDSSGLAVLDLWPFLRGAVPDGTAIVYTNPTGTFRLSSGLTRWTVAEAQIYGLDLAGAERLP